MAGVNAVRTLFAVVVVQDPWLRVERVARQRGFTAQQRVADACARVGQVRLYITCKRAFENDLPHLVRGKGLVLRDFNHLFPRFRYRRDAVACDTFDALTFDVVIFLKATD